jgi:hypothetical protein
MRQQEASAWQAQQHKSRQKPAFVLKGLEMLPIAPLIPTLVSSRVLSAFAASFTSLLGAEFMSVAAFVRGLAAHRCDFALLLGIHAGETSPALTILVIVICHSVY